MATLLHGSQWLCTAHAAQPSSTWKLAALAAFLLSVAAWFTIVTDMAVHPTEEWLGLDPDSLAASTEGIQVLVTFVLAGAAGKIARASGLSML